MKAKRVGMLAVAIIACLLAGAIGSVFTIESISGWYASLNKPFFTPPNWLFGPAWTTLYLLMGISLYLVWEKSGKDKKAKTAIIIFASQLALNILWSVIFFGLRLPFPAFVEIIALWLAIFFTIRAFYPISKKAAWLLVPYICWVSFAAALNLAVALLN